MLVSAGPARECHSVMQLDSSNIARVEAACNAVAAMMDTPAFRARFSTVRLLRTSQDIQAARKDLPHGLLPFMTEQQPASTDVYAFDLLNDNGERVVVWNDHAVVADWTNFDAFAGWLRGDPAAA
jgi:hypothetical protein